MEHDIAYGGDHGTMSKPKLRVAALCTECRPLSHADVILSRWLEPFPNDSLYGWTQPATRLTTIYAAQRHPQRDLIPAMQARFGIVSYDSIEGALMQGGTDLAVDAVLLIAEHGDYPENEFGQKLYPRKEFFDEMMRVFERAGRSVPVFFDKHLSWNPDWIGEMHDRIKRDAVPFFGGSSLPFSMEGDLAQVAEGTRFEEVVAVYYGGVESYLFHSAEMVESVIERGSRQSGGIDEIMAWKGERVWEAVENGDFSWELVEQACSACSDEALEAIRGLRDRRDPSVNAFRLHYENGLIVTHFHQVESVRRWCLAGRVSDTGEMVAGAGNAGGAVHYFPHFARLCRKIDDFFVTGQSPVPLERIYTTSMVTALCLRALASTDGCLSTPELQGRAEFFNH